MILATRSVLDFDRVLYENWTTIFNEIENENRVLEFHQLTYDKQKAKVREKVEQIKAKITIAGNEQAQETPAG
jgi:chaperonin cofactor prefoldin